MRTATVTIGRNINAVPMHTATWESFIQDTVQTVKAHVTGAHHWTEVHTGRGTWEDIPEDSARVTVTGFDSLAMASLTHDLACLARTYRQDAIALSSGLSVLVLPTD